MLLCLLSSRCFPGLRGDKACSAFQFVKTELSDRMQDRIVVAQIDFARLGVGATVCGWTMYKPLPRLILFYNGKKMAARTMRLFEARSLRVIDMLTEWMNQSLMTE